MRRGKYLHSQLSDEQTITGLISSSTLHCLDLHTLTFLKQVDRVVTDSNIDFELYFETVKEKLKADPKRWEPCLAIGAYYVISAEDFNFLS